MDSININNLTIKELSRYCLLQRAYRTALMCHEKRITALGTIIFFHPIAGSSNKEFEKLSERILNWDIFILHNPLFFKETNFYHDYPSESIPEMGRHIVDAIRSIKPIEPIILVGLSFGGLLAFDVSCKLNAVGIQVAQLFILDSQPPKGNLCLSASDFLERVYVIVEKVALSLRCQGFVKDLEKIQNEIIIDSDSYLEPKVCKNLIKSIFKKLFEILVVESDQRMLELRCMLNSTMHNLIATCFYTPTYVANEAIFYNAKQGVAGKKENASKLWRNYVKQLSIFSCDSDHFKLIENENFKDHFYAAIVEITTLNQSFLKKEKNLYAKYKVGSEKICVESSMLDKINVKKLFLSYLEKEITCQYTGENYLFIDAIEKNLLKQSASKKIFVLFGEHGTGKTYCSYRFEYEMWKNRKWFNTRIIPIRLNISYPQETKELFNKYYKLVKILSNWQFLFIIDTYINRDLDEFVHDLYMIGSNVKIFLILNHPFFYKIESFIFRQTFDKDDVCFFYLNTLSWQQILLASDKFYKKELAYSIKSQLLKIKKLDSKNNFLYNQRLFLFLLNSILKTESRNVYKVIEGSIKKFVEIIRENVRNIRVDIHKINNYFGKLALLITSDSMGKINFYSEEELIDGARQEDNKYIFSHFLSFFSGYFVEIMKNSVKFSSSIIRSYFLSHLIEYSVKEKEFDFCYNIINQKKQIKPEYITNRHVVGFLIVKNEEKKNSLKSINRKIIDMRNAELLTDWTCLLTYLNAIDPLYFSGKNISAINFGKALLPRANICYAILQDIDISAISLPSLRLEGSRLENCNLNSENIHVRVMSLKETCFALFHNKDDYLSWIVVARTGIYIIYPYQNRYKYLTQDGHYPVNITAVEFFKENFKQAKLSIKVAIGNATGDVYFFKIYDQEEENKVKLFKKIKVFNGSVKNIVYAGNNIFIITNQGNELVFYDSLENKYVVQKNCSLPFEVSKKSLSSGEVILAKNLTIKLYNSKKFKNLYNLTSRQKDNIKNIAVSKNKKYLVVGYDSGIIELYLYESGYLIHQLEYSHKNIHLTQFTESGGELIVSYTFDYQYLNSGEISTLYNNFVIIYNTEDMRPLHYFSRNNLVVDINFYKDNNYIIAYSNGEFEATKIINYNDFKIHDAHASPVITLVLLDNNYFASVEANGIVIFWDITADGKYSSFVLQKEGIFSAGFVEKNYMLITSSYNGSLKLWKFNETYLKVTCIGHIKNMSYVVPNPHGNIILLLNQSMQWLNFHSLLENKSSFFENEAMDLLNFHAKKGVYSNDGNYLGLLSLQGIKIYSLDELIFEDHLSYTCLNFSFDSQFVAVGYKTFIIEWNLENKTFNKIYPGEYGTISVIAYSSDNMFIAFGTSQGVIYIWNRTFPDIPSIIYAHTSLVSGLIFKNNKLVSACADSSICVWKKKTIENTYRWLLKSNTNPNPFFYNNNINPNDNIEPLLETINFFSPRLCRTEQNINHYNSFFSARSWDRKNELSFRESSMSLEAERERIRQSLLGPRDK